MKKVSVIIPVYNSEKYLTKCIESVLGQTYDAFELILVDDGSIDRSRDICQVYEKIDSRILILFQENRGASSARNAGLKYATGDYLLFVDSDDWIDNNLLENVVKKAEIYQADVVVFGWQCENRTKEIQYKIIQMDTILSGVNIVEKIIEDDDVYGGGYTWNKLWNMKKIKEHENQFDEFLFAYEDKVFAISNYIHLNRVLLVPEVYYHYLMREESLSHHKKFHWDVAENALLAQERVMDVLMNYKKLYKVALKKYYVSVAELLGSAVKIHNWKYIYMSCRILKNKYFSIILTYSNWSIIKRIKYGMVFIYARFLCLLLRNIEGKV